MKLWKKAKNIIKDISLVDKSLMIFMLILFIYIIIHLFTTASISQDTNAIDIIIRTSLASIFGYFISSNFVKNDSSASPQDYGNPEINFSPKSVAVNSDNSIKNQIGFQDPAAVQSEEIGKISISENTSPSTKTSCKFQIYVVSIIGLTSLIILIMAKHLQNSTSELTAIISQLRDFVSACIGFLVGCKNN